MRRPPSYWIVVHLIFLSIIFSILHAFQVPIRRRNLHNVPHDNPEGDEVTNEDESTDTLVGTVEETIFQVIFESPTNARTVQARLQYLAERKEDFFRCARENRIPIRLYGRLMPVMNGFYIRTEPIFRNIEILEECEYVESITEDLVVQSHSPDALTSSFLNLFKSQMKSDFKSISGWTGRNVKVGILDTGIDYLDPLFRTSTKTCYHLGSIECKVKKSIDLVRYFKKLKASHLHLPFHMENSTSVPYSNHGTVMAALITGKTSISSGIAPLVRLYDYRVVDPNSINTLSVVIHGLQTALDDNIEVLCLALGTSSRFLSHLLKGPILNRKGELVTVITSMGDSKSTALFQPNILGTSSYTLSVGSLQSPTSPCISAWFLPTTAPYWICFPTSGHLLEKLTFNSRPFFTLASTEEELFSMPLTLDLRNTMLILLFTPTAKSLIHLSSFFPWAIIVFEDQVPMLSSSFSTTILFGYFPLKDQRIRLLDELVFSRTPSNASTTSFSFQVHRSWMPMPSMIQSQGPTLDYKLKPDVILSPFPLLSTDPLFLSQLESKFPNAFPTSFSAALMTALAAIYKEARPNDTFASSHLPRNTARFHEVIMNTAMPLSIQEGDPILFNQPELKGLNYPVTHQGAGCVQLPLFLTTKVALTPSKFNLGHFFSSESPSTTIAQSKVVRLGLFNPGPTTITYHLYHRPSASLTIKPKSNSNLYHSKLDVFFLSQTGPPISLEQDSFGTFVLKGNWSTTIHIEFRFPTSWTVVDHSLLSGYLQLVPFASGPNATSNIHPLSYPVLHVPYLAVVHPSEKLFPYIDWEHWWDAFHLKRTATDLPPTLSPLIPTFKFKSKLLPPSTSTKRSTSTSSSSSSSLNYYDTIQPSSLTSQEVFDQRKVPFAVPLKEMRWPCFTFHLLYPLHQIRVYLYSYFNSKLLGLIGVYHQVESGVHALPFHFTSNQTKLWGWQGQYSTLSLLQQPLVAKEGVYYLCFQFLKSKFNPSHTPFPQHCSPSFQFKPSTPRIKVST